MGREALTANLRRYIVQVGMGVDQHGQDMNRAAQKAVADAIARSCLTGLIEIIGLRDPNDMLVHVKVACPYPEQVDREAVLAALPFGQRQLEVVAGGMTASTVVQPELGDKNDQMLVATAAVTVWVPAL
jgi:uncharacterized protein (TIGR02058 family)